MATPELLNEEDWGEYLYLLLGNLLGRLEEREATEVRQAFQDMLEWLRTADTLVAHVLIDNKTGLVKYATTPIDRGRIDDLMKARANLNLLERHLSCVVYARKVGGDAIQLVMSKNNSEAENNRTS